MNNLFCNGYPYTDFHEMNLSWLVKKVMELNTRLTEFVSLNTIKYADPIQWSITTQYGTNTVVIDPVSGVAYLSVKPVPLGVSLSNNDYWTEIFDLGQIIGNINKNLTIHNDGYSATSTFDLQKGDWVLWNGVLYTAIHDIDIGDAYVVDANIEAHSVEELVFSYVEDLEDKISDEAQTRASEDERIVLELTDLISSEVTAREDADTVLQGLIEAETQAREDLASDVGDISSLTTTDKSSVVNAINEIDSLIENISTLNVINVINDIGCDNTGSEDCADKINDYLASDTTGRPLLFPYGTYKFNDTVSILNRDVYILGQVFTRSDITLFRLSGKRMRFMFEKLGYSSGTDITSADIASAKGTAIEVIPDGDICNSMDIVGNYIMCDTGIKFSGYGTGFTQNINVKVDYWLCRSYCVKADSSTGKWINEIIFTGCSFNGSQNTDTAVLIQLHETTHGNLMNGWRFIGCAFENYNTVFDLEASKVYLTNCRMSRQEGFSASSSKYLKAVSSSTFHEQGYIEFASVDQNFDIDSSIECIITGTINNNGVVGTSCKIMNDGSNQFAFIDQGALGRAFNHTFTANSQSINCGYGYDLSKGIEINVGAYTGCTVTVVYNNNYRPSATSDGGYYTGFRPFVVTVTGTASVTLATPNALGGGTSHTLAGGSSYLITRAKTITL